MRKFLLIPYKQHPQSIGRKESPEGGKTVLAEKVGDTGPDTSAIPEEPAAGDTRPPTEGSPEKDQSAGVPEDTSQKEAFYTQPTDKQSNF